MVTLNDFINDSLEGKVLYVSEDRIGRVESARIDAGGLYYKIEGRNKENSVTWADLIDVRDE